MTAPAIHRWTMCIPVRSAIFSLSTGVARAGNVFVTTHTRLTSVNRLFSSHGLVT